MSRFDYVTFDEKSKDLQALFKKKFENLVGEIQTELFGSGRPRNHALDKLEESYMWVGKAIKDIQANRITNKKEGIAANSGG